MLDNIMIFFALRRNGESVLLPWTGTSPSTRKLPKKKIRVVEKKILDFHHDNISTHSSLWIRDYCVKSGTTVLPHPPHSLRYFPSRFFLFPKLKSTLKGPRFHSIDTIMQGQSQKKSTRHLPDLETPKGAIYQLQKGSL